MKTAEKQLEANRRNAQYSTGPKSENGKYNSSRNATKHGLFAIPQSTATHDNFTAAIIADLNPANDLERQTAQLIAEDHYRLNRIREISLDHHLLLRQRPVRRLGRGGRGRFRSGQGRRSVWIS